jgi:hypothetical protein
MISGSASAQKDLAWSDSQGLFDNSFFGSGLMVGVGMAALGLGFWKFGFKPMVPQFNVGPTAQLSLTLRESWKDTARRVLSWGSGAFIQGLDCVMDVVAEVGVDPLQIMSVPSHLIGRILGFPLLMHLNYSLIWGACVQAPLVEEALKRVIPWSATIIGLVETVGLASSAFQFAVTGHIGPAVTFAAFAFTRVWLHRTWSRMSYRHAIMQHALFNLLVFSWVRIPPEHFSWEDWAELVDKGAPTVFATARASVLGDALGWLGAGLWSVWAFLGGPSKHHRRH